ncbi:MAG: AIPR family protein [Gammaproteobacteria bacterium]|nr:AIPR family protein [Gammaproteobacteria bacterium]
MELGEFLHQTQADVKANVQDRLGEGGGYPYPESVFAEVVMEHMSEIGMTFEPAVCHYTAKVGNATLRLSGYAVSDEQDQLDLFISLYAGADEIRHIPDSETKKAAEHCLRFLARSADGTLAAKMEESDDAYSLTLTIHGCYDKLDQIRIYVLTDRRAKAKNFKSREIRGKTVKLEVMDIERLYHHWSTGRPRDELTVDFNEVAGGPLPCIYVPGEMSEYDYALTALPGEALRFVYDKYGDRLLEANVRSFLSVTGKVNKGIRDTLRSAPERFMAYNNGIVIVTDELRLGRTADGGPGVLWMRGMQVVNGGQTTASLFFSQRKHPNEIDLRRVRVPAKIIVLKTPDPVAEEEFVANISKYANSQNNVKQSDLSANKRFHREVENLASTTICPDGIGRWFYERAAGSYKTMLARDGTTAARAKRLRQAIPPARKITKTDLAKYLNAWEQLPHVVSFGAQKNFVRFMDRMTTAHDRSAGQSVTLTEFKRMIAKAIIYRTTQKVTRGRYPAFQANVVTYTVAVVACQLGARLDLDRVWWQQELSSELRGQIMTWADKVHAELHRTANGRMVSEWAKKPDCWAAVRSATYAQSVVDIPELTAGVGAPLRTGSG